MPLWVVLPGLFYVTLHTPSFILMTQVKLPSSNNKTGMASPTVKIALATLVLLLGGGLLWKAKNSNGVAAPQIRAATPNNASEPKQSATPGVHRYEMVLAQLQDDGTTTTRGTVRLETYDAWAPIGAQHFHKLVTSDQFYDECRFFRVVDNFVVQFGINGDPNMTKKWRSDVLKDDPVKETNAYGTLTYATSGANTRTTQLFINTRSSGNGGLDHQGFAPFGKVVQGMDLVQRINNEYHEKPNQGKIQNQGNAYLNKEFPRLSYIQSLRCVDDDTPDGENSG